MIKAKYTKMFSVSFDKELYNIIKEDSDKKEVGVAKYYSYKTGKELE